MDRFDRLEALGFFSHVPAADLGQVRRRMAETETLFDALDSLNLSCGDEPELTHGGGPTRRVYSADPEDLLEYPPEALDLIGQVVPFLRREGVVVDVEYGDVIVPATKQRPRSRGTARLLENGWLDERGPAPRVESLRVAFTPGSAMQPVVVRRDERSEVLDGERELQTYFPDSDEGWEGAILAVLRFLDECLAAYGSRERPYGLYFHTNDFLLVLATHEMARALNATTSNEKEKLFDAAGVRVNGP